MNRVVSETHLYAAIAAYFYFRFEIIYEPKYCLPSYHSTAVPIVGTDKRRPRDRLYHYKLERAAECTRVLDAVAMSFQDRPDQKVIAPDTQIADDHFL